jgi:hypothetical protein
VGDQWACPSGPVMDATFGQLRAQSGRCYREDCKSVAKATKVRILDPPHAVRTASDLRTTRPGAVPVQSHQGPPDSGQTIRSRQMGGKVSDCAAATWGVRRVDQGMTARSWIGIPSATRRRGRLSSVRGVRDESPGANLPMGR